jgi:hypothetical protein
MASSTRSRVGSVTMLGVFTTRDTVAKLTPARSATSLMVARVFFLFFGMSLG